MRKALKPTGEGTDEAPLQSIRKDGEWLFMKTMTDQLPVGVFIIEAPSERVLLRNRAFDDMTHMPPITTFREYERFFAALHRDGTPYAHNDCPIIRSITRNETVHDEEMVYKHISGAKLTLSVNSAPIVDESGKIAAGVAIYGDISARANSEVRSGMLSEAGAALAAELDEKHMLQQIAQIAIRNLADGCSIDLKRPDGALELAASEYRDPEKKRFGMMIRQKQYFADTTNFGAGMVMRTGRSALYHKIKPGVVKHVAAGYSFINLMIEMGLSSAMVVPLKIRGTTVGSITFVSTSEKRLFEKSDLKIAEELARRTALALENARLYADAKRAITLRDDFIGMASHELKTPITSMLMRAYLLEKVSEEKNDVAYLEHVHELERALKELTALIDELLDLSRVQTGRIEYHKEWFDIDRLVDEVLEVARGTTDKHRLAHVGEAHGKIHGDRERIGHVLMNLVTNAIKYSEGGDIIVTVWEEANALHVSVKDSGIGIPEQFQKSIFERFQQVPRAKEKTYPGLGIGLFIASEIIRAHGGAIWVESEEGQGSTFFFTLPAQKEKKEP